jgi:hypothetical protein
MVGEIETPEYAMNDLHLTTRNGTMSEDNSGLVSDEEEDEEISISRNENNIFTKSDPEIVSLHNKYKDGRLILQPDFQRQYVWDSKRASKLVESAVLLIPMPIILNTAVEILRVDSNRASSRV